MNAVNVVRLSVPQAASKTSKAGAPNQVHVRFDAFELDEPNALLLRDGTPITLAPRPFGLLCSLARRPGALLTKNALLDEVWGHQYLSESVLRTAITELRTVLGDDPREPRFIETVSRRGYRFIAATIPVSATAPEPAIRLAAHTSAAPCPATERGFCPVAANLPGNAKPAAACGAAKRDMSRADDERALPQAAYPSTEEMCYAHALKMRLRALFLGDAPPARLSMVGAD
jgi:DNA-binding winged helix-turn-helix (wHTH) protein